MGRKNRGQRNEGQPKKLPKKKGGFAGRYFNLLAKKNKTETQSSLHAGKAGNSKKNNTKEGETVPQVVLDIPLVVIAQVVSNIREIENLAERENIPLWRSQFILDQEGEETEHPSSSRIITGLKRPQGLGLDFIPLHKKSKKSSYYQKPHCKPVETEDKPPVESLDFISFKSERKYEDNHVLATPKEVKVKSPPAELDFISFKTETPAATKYEKLNNNRQPKTSTSSENSGSSEDIKVKTDSSEDVVCLSDSPEPKYENIDIKTDFISFKSKTSGNIKCLPKRQQPQRGELHYKYGYKDIITGKFEEKLDETLAKADSICMKSHGNDCLSVALGEEFQDMITRPQFKDMMGFREKLPAFKRSGELLDLINNNQVLVISGETGCGKSTQVPQIILDNALRQNQGAYVHILVTQPRRIAASSLATRVAEERAEKLGTSVGYAVRLEKADCRPRGSIMYVTTGILLADLEVNQGLSNYSHIILDEAHERDSHLDLSMCILKQVLKKRRDLKLILMSATLDSQRLCSYFDNCPVIHIEGLAYPVQAYYMEDVLALTKYRLPPNNRIYARKKKKRNQTNTELTPQEKDYQYKAAIDPWLKSVNDKLDKDVYTTLQDRRIENLNIDLVMALLFHICRGPPGAILVFLPGLNDIFRLIRTIKKSEMFPHAECQIYPLHSKLSTINQHKVFNRPPENIRKIIIATNIAETSITIDDIVYVVDCGRVKLKGLDVEHHITTLNTEFESKANLMQRRGRAGRCQPGVAYHLMTSYRSQNIPDRLLPELQRSNLLEEVLQIKKLRLGNAKDALELVPDPPSNVTVEKAVRHLQKLGALNDEECLTPLGWHLARLPVHPAAGKLLLFGALFGCIDRAASVAAVWGFKDPFNIVIGKELEINQIKRNLALGEPSDHVAISEAIIQWEQLDQEKQSDFARAHFLSNSTLRFLSRMKKQLCGSLRQMGFLASKNVRVSWENRNADNLCVFKAIVAAALYPNIALVRWANIHSIEKQQRISVLTPEDGKVKLHPSSMMHVPRGPQAQLCNKPGANWLVYWMKQKSSDLFLFEVTLVFTLPLLLFGELTMTEVDDKPEECYLSASTVKVRSLKGTADVIFRLRTLLDQVLASMVMETSDRSTRYSEFDNLVFKAVMDLMTLEDERPEGLEDEFSDTDSSDCEIVTEIKLEDRYPVIVID